MTQTARSTAELIARHIMPDAHRPGVAYAVLADNGTPVWALIGHLLGNQWDVPATATDYEVSPEAVEAAIAYYRIHQAVLDARIAPTLAFAQEV